MSDTDILSVECPYTSCGAKVGEVCTNARNGKPMPHGHKDRKKALCEAAKPVGHRVEMSYNAWQIVHLVACSMLREVAHIPPEADALNRLIDELPSRNFGKRWQDRRGRARVVYPKLYRQRFSGSVLIALKKVMEEAAQLKGGTFENTVCQIANRAQDIQVGTIDLLGSLSRG
jgi:hypothetical protein